jgi:hypothetical protein
MNAQLTQLGRKGNEHYSQRCALKRAIRSREASLTDLLYEPDIPDYLQTMRIVDLLDSVPRLTPRDYEPMLEAVPIKLTAVLSDTTYRKRRVLRERLLEWETGRRQAAIKAQPHGHGVARRPMKQGVPSFGRVA